MSDLADHLIADGPDLGPEPEAWTVGGDSEATWALRKIAQAEAEIARIRQQVIAETNRINDWGQAAERGPQSTIDFMAGKLIAYRRQLEDANPDLPQTYKVIGGKIARRKGRTSTRIVETDLFTQWAKAHAPETLKVTPQVSVMAKWARTVAGALISPDGETVPGVQDVQADDVYSVTAEPDLPSEF